jgi:hypothetical protein
LSQLVSVASGYGATEYDTKIPSLGDAANIVEAFKLYHYGLDSYNGSVSPAEDSIESHLVNLKSLIDQKLSISSASSTYATFAYAVEAASSASAHVNTLSQARDNLKANISSPTFTGTQTFSGTTNFLSASVMFTAASVSGILASQIGNQGKFLTTDGTTAYWEELPSAFDASFLLGGM